jgi:hypothetical protein
MKTFLFFMLFVPVVAFSQVQSSFVNRTSSSMTVDWTVLRKYIDGTYSSLAFFWTSTPASSGTGSGIGFYDIILEAQGGLVLEAIVNQDGGANQTDFEANFMSLTPRKLQTNVTSSVSVSNFPSVQAVSSTQLPAALDGSGFLKVHEQGTASISATSLPLPTGAATSANQTNGTQITQVSSLPSLPAGTNSIGTTTPTFTPTANNSGTCISGTLSTVALASNSSRKAWFLEADPANTDVVYVKLGATATATNLKLSPGQAFNNDTGTVYTGEVDFLPASGTQKVCVFEL